MDDPRVLRIITVGLILAALAVVYFLFTGAFSGSKTKVSQNQTTSKSTPTPSPVVSATPEPSPSVIGQAQPTPVPTATSSIPPAAARALNNKGGTSLQSLPNTGFPGGLAIIFSASAVAFGFGLRRFPK